ncbi:phosphotriesterase [Cytobacillus kochii]|uniref:phosphotriesterase family protein n=1 Tax=Cytobacillus kochii TaxID=859143 RepID=UPI002E23185F|nr:phosphotriesterase [Cytobacillus kochii]
MLDQSNVVNTVLGPVLTKDLGVVLIHESLLSVVPGAEYAPEIRIDKSEIFEILKQKLLDFRRVGGGTIVDRTGMFHGRDIKLYENLSKATGVHIVASTGLGPQPMLSGYFTTPQKNPPIPWPAEKFAGLFIKEVTEGIVVPRVERSSAAGLVTSIASHEGIAELEINLFKGSGQTAMVTGVPVSVQFGSDAVAELEIILEEGIKAERIIIGGLDRISAVNENQALGVVQKGAYVAIDHIGWSSEEGFINDTDRAELIAELIQRGYSKQILLSTNAVGVAKGHMANDVKYDYLLTSFVPKLRNTGITDNQIKQLLEDNPQRVLTMDK